MTHLALADLLTALTMPLTAMDSLWLHWPLADQNLLFCRCVMCHVTCIMCHVSWFMCHVSCCRLVKCLPCVSVYMSSLTIMAIAVDRHRVICKPTFSQVGQ